MDTRRSFKDAVARRRSYYSITNKSPISDAEIEDIVKFAATNIPSAFNSQSARLVLLLGRENKKFWDIVKDALKDKLGEGERFAQTEKKIDGSFSCGYGTILFFEDRSVIENLQDNFPSYSDRFPDWSHHTSAMHQFALWTMLEDAGFGASLQHYNPLIDEKVREEWKLPESWKLVAEMPFGEPSGDPGVKEMNPLEERVKVFKS